MEIQKFSHNGYFQRNDINCDKELRRNAIIFLLKR